MKSTLAQSGGAPLAQFVASAWPPIAASDSETQRRKKLAVRGGQLALVVMVSAAIIATVFSNQRATTGQIAAFIVVGVAYLFWSLKGIHRGIQVLLWQGDSPAPSEGSIEKYRRGNTAYFVVQLALAGMVNYLGGIAGSMSLTWIVLLPPVAHSVILLSRSGIVVVSVTSMLIWATTIAALYGWNGVPVALVQFFFAVMFTVVFALLAVSSERARAEVQFLAHQLSESNQKLREHAVQVEELAAARERNRLAREIHDNLGHCLTVVNVQIEAARALWESDPQRAREAAEKAQSLTQQSLQEIRHSVAALRASPLDNKTLVEAVQQIVDENRAAGLAIDLQIEGELRKLSPPVELTLYRTAQEGLTNVRKHAQARLARLILDFRNAASVRMLITDDGLGTDQNTEASPGFGLLGLRERAHLLGGTVRVRSSAGSGFTLEVEVPG